ncbi:hypothetical protein [Dactylosporangium sp. CA-092794]|uniref:hypothetical protein n=1 Tax=Dactylosporangium sp. CA-092794 TaxID=3239929 RepID=UPI003D8B9410
MCTTATPTVAIPVRVKLVMLAAVLLTALGMLALTVRDTHWTGKSDGVSAPRIGAGGVPNPNTPQDTIW